MSAAHPLPAQFPARQKYPEKRYVTMRERQRIRKWIAYIASDLKAGEATGVVVERYTHATCIVFQNMLRDRE